MKTSVDERLIGLDVLKGLLTCKIAFAHLFAMMGYGLLGRLASMGQEFTFGVLLFCFGLGLGLSKRPKSLTPFWTLCVAYAIGSAVSICTLDAAGIPSWSPVTWNEAAAFFTLRMAPAYVDYIQSFAFFYLFVLAFQSARVRLPDLPAGVLVALSLLIYVIGVLLATTAPTAPGSVFWNDGFRTLQYAPVFFGGMAFSRSRAPFVSLSRMPVHALGLLAGMAAVCYLMPKALAAMGTDSVPFKLEGSLLACASAVWFSVASIAVAESISLRFKESATVRYFGRIGKRLALSLLIQVCTVPLIALIASGMPGAPGAALVVGYLLAMLAALYYWPSKGPRAKPVLVEQPA